MSISAKLMMGVIYLVWIVSSGCCRPIDQNVDTEIPTDIQDKDPIVQEYKFLFPEKKVKLIPLDEEVQESSMNDIDQPIMRSSHQNRAGQRRPYVPPYDPKTVTMQTSRHNVWIDSSEQCGPIDQDVDTELETYIQDKDPIVQKCNFLFPKKKVKLILMDQKAQKSLMNDIGQPSMRSSRKKRASRRRSTVPPYDPKTVTMQTNHHDVCIESPEQCRPIDQDVDTELETYIQDKDPIVQEYNFLFPDKKVKLIPLDQEAKKLSMNDIEQPSMRRGHQKRASRRRPYVPPYDPKTVTMKTSRHNVCIESPEQCGPIDQNVDTELETYIQDKDPIVQEYNFLFPEKKAKLFPLDQEAQKSSMNDIEQPSMRRGHQKRASRRRPYVPPYDPKTVTMKTSRHNVCIESPEQCGPIDQDVDSELETYIQDKDPIVQEYNFLFPEKKFKLEPVNHEFQQKRAASRHRPYVLPYDPKTVTKRTNHQRKSKDCINNPALYHYNNFLKSNNPNSRIKTRLGRRKVSKFNFCKPL